jgi:protein-tyrosine-phosphatase
MTPLKILFISMMGQDRSKKAMEIINEEFSDRFEAKCTGVSEIADISLTKQARFLFLG